MAIEVHELLHGLSFSVGNGEILAIAGRKRRWQATGRPARALNRDGDE